MEVSDTRNNFRLVIFYTFHVICPAPRSFQSGFRWSAVESRLVAVIEQLWADLRANANLNLEHEIEKRFLPVCKRLEQTILVPSS